MIEHQHRIAAWNAIETTDGNRNPHGRQSGAGDAADRPPAPIKARQDHDGGPCDDGTQPDDDPPPSGVERLAQHSALPHELRSNTGKRQAQDLPPQRALRRIDLPAFIKFLGGAPPDLAARCLGHRSRRGKDNLIGWRPGDVAGNFLRARLHVRTGGGIGLTRFRQDDHPLRAGCAIGHAEYRDAALADSRNFSDGVFDFLRIDMAAGANDDVLDAACNADVASGHIRAVAAVEPTIVKEFAGLGLVAEIAACRRRSPELEPSFPPFAEFVTRLVDDANFVAGQRLAAWHDFQRLWIVRPGRLGHPARAQPITVDTINDGQAAERRKRQADRAFRKTVDRRHRLRGETVVAKSVDKSPQGLHADRFCAIRNHAQ